MQLLQLWYFRLKRDLGIWTAFIVIILFLVLQYIAGSSYTAALCSTAVCFVFLFNYHQNRRDLPFIQKFLLNPAKQLLIQYQLMALPCSMALVSAGHWMPAAVLHLLSFTLPFTRKIESAPKLNGVVKFIPSKQFEWRSGIRTNFISLTVLLILSVALSPVKLFAVAILFLLNIILLGFYNRYEPRIMVDPEKLGARAFLMEKINYAVKMVLCINVPILLVNTLFHPDMLTFNVIFTIAFILLTANMILLKYVYYQPYAEPAVTADSVILLASVFIPYLLPLTVLLYFSNRKKAINNLNLLFDAEDKN